MGFSTFLIGCVPSFETIGYAAPVLVLILRLLQGLALGGEYGGAATYVAEYSQPHRRGYWTSWIQTTATAGLFISLIVILVTKTSLTPEEFDSWGWRIPFWISILMVGVSYVIRRNMEESPLFAQAKREGKTSTNPLKESFGNKFNFKFVLLALFGAVMGQGVIWYTGQFYAMSFMQKVMNIDSAQVDSMMALALFLGTPLFILFGWLSDKVGRKPIMMIGMLIAIIAYRPIYKTMYTSVNIENKVLAEKGLVQKRTAKAHEKISGDSLISFHTEKTFTDGTLLKRDSIVHWAAAGPVMTNGKAEAPLIKESITVNPDTRWLLVFLVFVQVVFVTMVYGPIAAFLVEMFPIRIRYTSMSLPYHIGNGIFGGFGGWYVCANLDIGQNCQYQPYRSICRAAVFWLALGCGWVADRHAIAGGDQGDCLTHRRPRCGGAFFKGLSQRLICSFGLSRWVETGDNSPFTTSVSCTQKPSPFTTSSRCFGRRARRAR